jgi:hypothetical protein
MYEDKMGVAQDFVNNNKDESIENIMTMIKDMAAEIRFLRTKIGWCEENIKANIGVD